MRCFWSPSGRYFVSGSYDKSVCIFRLMGGDSHSAFEMGVGIEVEMIRQLTFKGAVEGIAMRKVMITNFYDSICICIHSRVSAMFNFCEYSQPLTTYSCSVLADWSNHCK